MSASGVALPMRAFMGKALVLLATALVLLLSPSFAFSLEDAFRITGVAVSEQGGAPIAGCHITAMRSGQVLGRQGRPSRPGSRSETNDLSTETDALGRFTLNLPSAGSWQVYGYRRGFRRQAFDRHENFFSAVVLTPGAPTYDMKFVLEPDSAISGFVLDEAGDGVRTARLTLFGAEPPGTDLAESASSPRAMTVTDDRGHYEFADLAPGGYVVTVQAEPWYAAGSRSHRFSQNGTDTPIDPLLDVVYPQTFFPGVSDRRSADVLSLHHGESRQADFHLTPIPATHLHISPPSSGSDTQQRGQIFPQIERIQNEGNPFVNTSVQVDNRGQIDVGGLSPGLYRVTLRGPGGQQTPSYVRVPGGSTRTIDLSAAATSVCELALKFDPAGGETGRLQVTFQDLDTGSTFVSYANGGLQRRGATPGPDLSADERKLEIPPGRYRVTLNGNSDTYLAGLSVKGEIVSGRAVSLSSGPTALTLRLTRGRAAVEGVTSLGDTPLRGAMVILVPAAFGQPGSIPVLRRDQTNTDGSFLFENVIPGDYILLAIDGGWTVNWRDPSTLAGYLIHGIPMTLASGVTTRQDLVAQRP